MGCENHGGSESTAQSRSLQYPGVSARRPNNTSNCCLRGAKQQLPSALGFFLLRARVCPKLHTTPTWNPWTLFVWQGLGEKSLHRCTRAQTDQGELRCSKDLRQLFSRSLRVCKASDACKKLDMPPEHCEVQLSPPPIPPTCCVPPVGPNLVCPSSSGVRMTELH